MAHVVFDCFPGGKRKALTMSYDDGTVHDRRLVETFNRHAIRATFHLNSGRFDSEGYLKGSEVAALFAGHEVAVHGLSHPCLPHLPKEGVIREIMEDRRTLERLVGYVVRGMSYPGCDFNDALVQMLPSLGIEYARVCYTKSDFAIPDDLYRWPPSCHHQKGVEKAQAFLRLPPQWGLQLLCVWGHSAEFELSGNWGLIEQFCSITANNEAIWYATAIEVVDYMRAVRSVRCSVDGNTLYNPSSIPVWFSLWEYMPVEVRAVQPGQTLSL